jgi:hypothetical protein
MADLDLFRAGEICDGAADVANAAVSAGAQPGLLIAVFSSFSAAFRIEQELGPDRRTKNDRTGMRFFHLCAPGSGLLCRNYRRQIAGDRYCGGHVAESRIF